MEVFVSEVKGVDWFSNVGEGVHEWSVLLLSVFMFDFMVWSVERFF